MRRGSRPSSTRRRTGEPFETPSRRSKCASIVMSPVGCRALRDRVGRGVVAAERDHELRARGELAHERADGCLALRSVGLGDVARIDDPQGLAEVDRRRPEQRRAVARERLAHGGRRLVRTRRRQRRAPCGHAEDRGIHPPVDDVGRRPAARARPQRIVCERHQLGHVHPGGAAATRARPTRGGTARPRTRPRRRARPRSPRAPCRPPCRAGCPSPARSGARAAPETSTTRGILDLGVVDRVAGQDVVLAVDDAPERVELHVGILKRPVAEEELVGGHGFRLLARAPVAQGR